MNRIPFRDIEEAKENAKLLCRAFAFYEISLPSAQNSIGLQQTQELMSRSFHCAGWKDLIRRVELQESVTYLDASEDRTSSHVKLAQELHTVIGDDIPLKTLRAAIVIAAVGCSPQARNEVRKFFSLCPAKTAAEWGWLIHLKAAFTRQSRYSKGRTAFEIQMLEYSHQALVAKVLGTPIPKKPQRRK